MKRAARAADGAADDPRPDRSGPDCVGTAQVLGVLMARQDPWLSERMRADARIRRGERDIYNAVITAMTIWLDTTRQLVLGQPVPALTAAADDPIPDIDAAHASFAAWARALENHVEPAIAEAFGEAFAAQSRAADISPVHFQEHHMATVHDRLKIWPEGAFEELRPELLEAMQQNESIEQITDRIGRILDIDAPSRRIRADISAIDAEIADPSTDRDELPFLRGKRRRLWNQHDESQQQWKWLARRIARTEIQGAVEGGSLASAQATAEATGEEMYKAWLSTSDERTRASHNVADGQIVKLAEPFRVGVALLMHPAFPGGPAHEVINCRCTMRILTGGEMQAELQGVWGGRGVSPMGARLGPDDEADAATAIDRLNRERRGEVLDPIERTEPDVQDAVNADDGTQESPEILEPDDEPFTTPHDDIPDLEDDIPDDELHVADEEPDLDTDDEELPDNPAVEGDPTDDSDNETEPDDDQPDPDPADIPEMDEEPEPEIIERPTGGPTPEDAEALAGQFDRDFAEPISQLSDEERAAVRRWQGMDRFYRRIQDVVRNEAEDEEAQDVIDALLPLLSGNAVQSDVVLYRGIRNVSTLIRRTNSDLERYIGQTIPTPGFLAASTSREQATSGFTRPFVGGGPVLFELTVRAGTPAFWIAGAGDPAMTDQRELLMDVTMSLLIVGVNYSGNVPTVQAEVI
ncbi:phage minor head protein [Rhodococcus sp. IEGM 1409]|uniref:phage minor head protein n=1 Tax=Rhodococcus sp. IEGM 1409 TaxID=3047082 RepID=UPI0024B78270|nr:phage minor head protein [Rhodococcus sp. IEGM 1409]MDI9898465.1 phage minor head protein [Rhodococcus sp. IEGM 1409]